jgi:excisionase family DNA binding protein
MHKQKNHNTLHQAQLLETVEDAARRLGVGRSTVYELLRTNQLEAVKIGRARRVVIASTIRLVERLRNQAVA